jgi:hypothetical protein
MTWQPTSGLQRTPGRVSSFQSNGSDLHILIIRFRFPHVWKSPLSSKEASNVGECAGQRRNPSFKCRMQNVEYRGRPIGAFGLRRFRAGLRNRLSSRTGHWGEVPAASHTGGEGLIGDVDGSASCTGRPYHVWTWSC